MNPPTLCCGANVKLSPEVKNCFQHYPWPGNIRELDNVIKSAYAACDDFIIEINDLPAKMVSRHHLSNTRDNEEKKLTKIMDDYERHVITEALKKMIGTFKMLHLSWAYTEVHYIKR